MNDKRPKIVLALIIIVIAGFAAISIFTLAQRAGKAAITISVLPEDATITLDGRTIKNGKFYVVNGNHALKASREHFSPQEIKIDTHTIDPNIKGSNVFYILLKPSDNEGKKLVLNDKELGEALEGAGGKKADVEQAKILKRFPVVDQLPYDTLEYRIDYGLRDQATKIVFTITVQLNAVVPGTTEYNDEYDRIKSDALAWLEKQGINTRTATIDYVKEDDAQN